MPTLLLLLVLPTPSFLQQELWLWHDETILFTRIRRDFLKVVSSCRHFLLPASRLGSGQPIACCLSAAARVGIARRAREAVR